MGSDAVAKAVVMRENICLSQPKVNLESICQGSGHQASSQAEALSLDFRTTLGSAWEAVLSDVRGYALLGIKSRSPTGKA